MELLNAQGHVRNRILQFRHKEGPIRQVVLTAEKVQIQGETLLLGMISEHTELEEVRHRLAFSEARYRLLSEACSEGVALLKNGIVVEANEQLAKMLGVPREGLMGQPMHHGMQAALDSVPPSSTHDAAPGVYNYVRTDGTMLSLETRSRALMQNGELMHLATLSDKTRQVQSERSLKDLQASIAHLMASNIVGMMVLDASGAVLEANNYVLDLLQRRRSALEAGALNWHALTPAPLQDAIPPLAGRGQGSGGTAPYEQPMLRADGTLVHLLLAVAPLPDTQDRALVIALDISKQKDTQAQLLQINSQLEVRTLEAEHAQAVKTLFLSSISHELRTPLHTILGYVRLLRKKALAEDALAEDAQQLGIVERRATYLLRLIDDLLEFNHTLLAPENLHEDDVNLQGFVRCLGAMFSKLARQSGNTFSMTLAPDLPAGVVLDEGRLEQVLRILVDNACKYTSEGSIALSLSGQPLPHRPGHICLAVSLEDTGRGMAEEDIAHIFEPLRRGSNAQDRPGLGLAIARQWVERMGGQLQVHSTLGRGSRFCFALVLQDALPPPPSAPALQTSAEAAGPALYVPMNQPPLSEADLAMLGQLIGMGRMGRIGTWARQLAASKPALQDVAEHLAGLAANAEVDKLERLYQNWMN